MKITCKTTDAGSTPVRCISVDGQHFAYAQEGEGGWDITVFPPWSAQPSSAARSAVQARAVAADFDGVRSLVRDFAEKQKVPRDLTFLYLGFSAVVRAENEHGWRYLPHLGPAINDDGEIMVSTERAQQFERKVLNKGLWVFRDEAEAEARAAEERKREEQLERNAELLNVIRAERPDWDRARELLEEGADPNGEARPQVSGYPRPPRPLLHLACEPTQSGAAGVDAIRFLLENGADAKRMDTHAEEFLSAFHALFSGWPYRDTDLGAWHSDNENACELLLAHGADPNVRDHRGRTALGMAVLHGSPRIVKMLLEAGADPNLADFEKGRAPLLVSCLREVDPQLLEIQRLLLAHGADPNASEFDGRRRPLLAVLDTHARSFPETIREKAPLVARAVRALTDAGADASIPDDAGHTPLHRAMNYRSLELVELLVKAGGDVNRLAHGGGNPNHRRQSPLVQALAIHHPAWKEGEHEAFLDRLMELGGDLTGVDCYGSTLLHQAGGIGGEPMMWWLLNRDAIDVNQRDQRGCTPLHRAAHNAAYAQCRLLLDAGADPLIRDIWGRTPADLVRMSRGKIAQDIHALLTSQRPKTAAPAPEAAMEM